MSCLRVLFANRRLIWNLTLLDFKMRYAGSKLGLVWMLIAPLLLLGAYLTLFARILRVGAGPGLAMPEYGLLVAAGLLPWFGFSEGVTRGTGSVLAHRNLMKSRLFPMELIPVTAVCVGLVGQLGGTALILLVLALNGKLGSGLLFLPVLLILQTLFSIGIVWVLSCVNILYRDTSQVVSLLMVLLMFLSPIAYSQQMVPVELGLIVKLNPLAYLIEGYRESLVSGQVPNLWGLAAFAGLSFASLLAGHHYFTRLRRVLPDYV